MNYADPWIEGEGDEQQALSNWSLSGADDDNTSSGVLYVAGNAGNGPVSGYADPWWGYLTGFSDWSFTGATPSNTDNGTLYVQVTDLGNGTWVVSVYKDSGLANLVASGFASAGATTLAEQNGSGLSGSVYAGTPPEGGGSGSLSGAAVYSTQVTISVYREAQQTTLVARGSATAAGTLTLAEENFSGLSGSVDVAAVAFQLAGGDTFWGTTVTLTGTADGPTTSTTTTAEPGTTTTDAPSGDSIPPAVAGYRRDATAASHSFPH